MKLLSLAPLAGPAVDGLRAIGSLEIDPWIDHVPIKLHAAAELTERLRGIEILLVEADHVPASVIESSQLLAIATCRGDPVNIDIDAATSAGVAVIRAPGRNARGVAELALALALALMRHVVAADDDIRAGRWVVDGAIAQQRFPGSEIGGKTVGLIGLGEVGRKAAELFSAVGADVFAFDPYVSSSPLARMVPLRFLLASSDIVSLHAAVTEETRGMIGAAEIALMKPGAYLVNTARFGLVDEEPLLRALRGGALAGAAFDHFTNEFLPQDHPLASMPNVILTPHLGGTTRETIVHHTAIVEAGLQALLRGEAPPSLANPDVLPVFTRRLQQ